LKTEIVSFYAKYLYVDAGGEELGKYSEGLKQFYRDLKPRTLIDINHGFGVGSSTLLLDAISTDENRCTLFKIKIETMNYDNQLQMCQAYFKLTLSELDKLCENFATRVITEGIELRFD